MKTAALRKVSYDPSIFDIQTVEEAMRVIVTPEAGMTTEHRWDRETSVLIELIEPWMNRAGRVLDYGCGIGRLAKPLISKFGARIVGVDISPNMRALAESYVASDQFMTLPPAMLDLVKPEFDLVICVWTLQHILDLDLRIEINDIASMLRDGGKLFVVNNVGRVVPTTGGWIDDGIDVRAVLADQFTELEHGQLPDEIAPGSFKDATFWAAYQK